MLAEGLVERDELFRAFNMGLGMVAVLRDGFDIPEGAVLVGELVDRVEDEPCQLVG